LVDAASGRVFLVSGCDGQPTTNYVSMYDESTGMLRQIASPTGVFSGMVLDEGHSRLIVLANSAVYIISTATGRITDVVASPGPQVLFTGLTLVPGTSDFCVTTLSQNGRYVRLSDVSGRTETGAAACSIFFGLYDPRADGWFNACDQSGITLCLLSRAGAIIRRIPLPEAHMRPIGFDSLRDILILPVGSLSGRVYLVDGGSGRVLQRLTLDRHVEQDTFWATVDELRGRAFVTVWHEYNGLSISYLKLFTLDFTLH
jgi:hypothetical protein